MATKKYIAVNASDGSTNEKIILTNARNEFTGKLKATFVEGQPAEDVTQVFISGIKVNGELINPTPVNGKRIIDFPEIAGGASPTTVFTADDPTGKTPVENLTITPSQTPQKGDVLIVSHTISNGVVERSAYVYSGTAWTACDGNVDASKVILTSNLQMNGDYDKVGNFVNDGGTIPSKGKSVQELLVNMFYADYQPPVETPSYLTFKGSGETLTFQQISGLTANQIKGFNVVDGLPETYQVENARQVLVFVASQRDVEAETANGLPYYIGLVQNPSTGSNLTRTIDGETYYVWQISSDRKFSDTIHFTWS